MSENQNSINRSAKQFSIHSNYVNMSIKKIIIFILLYLSLKILVIDIPLLSIVLSIAVFFPIATSDLIDLKYLDKLFEILSDRSIHNRLNLGAGYWVNINQDRSIDIFVTQKFFIKRYGILLLKILFIVLIYGLELFISKFFFSKSLITYQFIIITIIYLIWSFVLLFPYFDKSQKNYLLIDHLQRWKKTDDKIHVYIYSFNARLIAEKYEHLQNFLPKIFLYENSDSYNDDYQVIDRLYSIIIP
jgi:hypothetical protein